MTQNRAAVAATPNANAPNANARASHAPIAMAILLAMPILLLGCPENPYICANGTPTEGTTTSPGVTDCAACNDGYWLHTGICVANTYTCANGTPVTEVVPEGMHGENRCASCDAGYTLTDTACEPDNNGDNNAADQTLGAWDFGILLPGQ